MRRLMLRIAFAEYVIRSEQPSDYNSAARSGNDFIDARRQRKETAEHGDGQFKAKVFSISPLVFSCTCKSMYTCRIGTAIEIRSSRSEPLMFSRNTWPRFDTSGTLVTQRFNNQRSSCSAATTCACEPGNV